MLCLPFQLKRHIFLIRIVFKHLSDTQSRNPNERSWQGKRLSQKILIYSTTIFSFLKQNTWYFLLIHVTLLCRRIHRPYRACLQSLDGRPRSSFPVVALITSRPWSPTVQFTLKLGAFPGWRASALLIPVERQTMFYTTIETTEGNFQINDF